MGPNLSFIDDKTEVHKNELIQVDLTPKPQVF